MTEPLVEAYNDEQHGQVVEVLAEAYLTNPINVAVLGGAGPEQRRQNRAIFELTLPEMLPGTKLVAIHDGAIVGFIHWVSYCRPTQGLVRLAGI